MGKSGCLGIFLLIAALVVPGKAQVQITLGPDEIAENQAWTITITVNNDRLRSYDNFPDIEGFKKRGTSTQSQTSIVNGQISSSQSVIMTYVPTRQGVFTVPAFKMKINDQLLSANGKKVKVGPPAQAPASDPFRGFFDRDPSTDFFGRSEPEFIDVKEDALLALSTSSDEVFVGEGFTATLSFLVADNNRAPMQFYELGKQLADILKKLKPANCWEENFNIENIEGESIEINGKGYTQYKVYQATYYPLNNKAVVFPSVGLEMIKFKVAKNPSFFGQNRKEEFKTFYSKPKTVRVKELPPHPLQQVVAVGDYRLQEQIATTQAATGQSVAYEFSVSGQGNISAVEKPPLVPSADFEFYEPNVKQNINREYGRVTGTKQFSYFLIPKEPGTFALADYFQWVFFNTSKKRYDTLRSQLTLSVSGESQKNQAIESTDVGSFYDQIESTDNTLQSLAPASSWNWLFNLLTVLALLATAYLLWKR
jgi:hypothetical protein